MLTWVPFAAREGPSAPPRRGNQISSSSLWTFMRPNRAQLLKPASARKIKARGKNSKAFVKIAGKAEARGAALRQRRPREGPVLLLCETGTNKSPWSRDAGLSVKYCGTCPPCPAWQALIVLHLLWGRIKDFQQCLGLATLIAPWKRKFSKMIINIFHIHIYIHTHRGKELTICGSVTLRLSFLFFSTAWQQHTYWSMDTHELRIYLRPCSMKTDRQTKKRDRNSPLKGKNIYRLLLQCLWGGKTG